jgi:hypothetical protein
LHPYNDEVLAVLIGKPARNMLLTTSEQRASTEYQQILSCIWVTHWAVQQHQPIITVLAACMGKNGSDRIATIS